MKEHTKVTTVSKDFETQDADGADGISIHSWNGSVEIVKYLRDGRKWNLQSLSIDAKALAILKRMVDGLEIHECGYAFYRQEGADTCPHCGREV